MSMALLTLRIIPLTDRVEFSIKERSSEVEIIADLDRATGALNGRSNLRTDSISSTVELGRVCNRPLTDPLSP